VLLFESCSKLQHAAPHCNTVGLEELPAMDFLLRCYSSENIASAAERTLGRQGGRIRGGGGKGWKEEERGGEGEVGKHNM